ncbi:phage integrase central domain-containing protein, partial [Gilliamella sp. B3493]
MFFLSKLFKSTKPQTVNQWLDEYIKILDGRNLKPKTIEIKTYLIKVIRQQIGDNPLPQITPPDISKIIKIYTDQDKAPSAKCMYHLLKDVFREAYAHGW